MQFGTEKVAYSLAIRLFCWKMLCVEVNESGETELKEAEKLLKAAKFGANSL